jgi:hypothetical protein
VQRDCDGNVPGKRTLAEQIYGASADDRAAVQRQSARAAAGNQHGRDAATDRESGEPARAGRDSGNASFQKATQGASSEVPFRTEMETAFGTGFSDVRSYFGRHGEMTELSASAAARGAQIAFASGAPDKGVVAHELAHVVQHRQAHSTAVTQLSSSVGDTGSPAEAEADDVARRVVAGERVRVSATPTSAIHRSPPNAGAAAAAGTDPFPVTLDSFLGAGTALNGQALGYQVVGTFHQYGVELRFTLGQGERRFHDIKPRQYSGPEAKWIRHGPPLNSAAFIPLLRDNGTGWDDPLDMSITRQPGRVAYRDTPGPEIGAPATARGGRPSRVHAVQNFTGWVEGIPSGGSTAQRISPVIAWFSIVSLVDENWEHPEQLAHYVQMASTQAGQGWRPTDPPSI